MNRFTFLTDIAGRVTLDVTGSPLVTAAAVVLPSVNLAKISAQLPADLPKWKSCSYKDAEAVINLLISNSAVGIFSINKDTKAWGKFWEDEKSLQSAIVLQDRRPAGFIKPANLLAFSLIGGACAIAMGHSLRIGPKDRIMDSHGRNLIERTIICDSDIGGEENVQVFKNLWDRQDGSSPRLEQAGFRVMTREVRVETEQQEPLLLLADYAAGIAHAALLSSPGRIRLPLPTDEAKKLLDSLNEAGKLALHVSDFNFTYKQIFGSLIDLAQQTTP
jgi:hypothetical protein